jgi:carboxymethylenebutenolidase
MVSVEFPSNDSTAPGYLAMPSSGSGIPVVVLQEWWGVDEHIRDVCHRFAAEGFVALAPDLYRGETTDQPDEAEQKMMALSIDQAERDMRGAVDFISEHEAAQTKAVGTVGFCLGGALSVWAAAANPKVKAAVVYYYVMPHGKPDFTKVNGPVLGHFGTSDDFIPLSDSQALETEMRDAGIDTTFEYYEGRGHAFFNDTNRMGTYDEQAAQQSWQKTLDFLRAHLS